MSSDRPRDAHSPEPGAGEPRGLASLLRQRGAPLVDAVERHLPGSRDHAEATSAYAFAAAVGLGFDRAPCDVIREAALLHDVGLIYVPAEIAAKPAGERDPDERTAWAGHYEAGYRLARGAGIPEHVCAWLLRARERYDGAGPEGLAGELVPVESRVIRAACVCQTALAGAAAAPGETGVGEAIATLGEAAGGALDPRVVDALAAILGRAAQ